MCTHNYKIVTRNINNKMHLSGAIFNEGMKSMIKSMTGFGRSDYQLENIYFNVELKSVNNRYVDISIKLPRRFTYLEENIRSLVKSYVERGRIELYITYQNIGDSDVKITADMPLAREYLNSLLQIEENLKVKNNITTSLIATFPDVIKIEKREDDEEEIWNCLKEALNGALAKLVLMRKEEGARLKEDIGKRLSKINTFLQQIKERTPVIVEEYKQKLADRIKELLDEQVDLDEGRLALEVALFADKSNITEEIVRLGSHIDQLNKTLEEDEAVGRKLDFLIQEMNREINTIGSKANDLIVANLVINVKSELEKIREQVQNIE